MFVKIRRKHLIYVLTAVESISVSASIAEAVPETETSVTTTNFKDRIELELKK
jgi:hypothetical protein